MSDKVHNTSTDAVTPELEVRLLALLSGEASEFERDQLEQMLAVNPAVAAVYAELQQLHQALVEIGSGEVARVEDPWKLSPARREKLLGVLGGQVAAEDLTPRLSIAHKEQHKWNAMPFSRAFVSVVTVVCVVGLVCALSLPSVQMAREAVQRGGALALFDSPPRGSESATPAADAVTTPPSIDFLNRFAGERSLREGRTELQTDKLESVKSELQETLKNDLITPAAPGEASQYFFDGVANQPLESRTNKQSAITQEGPRSLDVTDLAAADHSGNGLAMSAGYGGEGGDYDGAMGGYGGAMGGYGGVAGGYGGGMRGGGLGGAVDGPTGTGSTQTPQSAVGEANLGEGLEYKLSVGEPAAAAAELEELSRLRRAAEPRIIVTDEKAADKESALPGQNANLQLHDWFSAGEQDFVGPSLITGQPDEAAPPAAASQAPSADDSSAALFGVPSTEPGHQSVEASSQDPFSNSASAAGEWFEEPTPNAPAGAVGRVQQRAGARNELGESLQEERQPLKQAQQKQAQQGLALGSIPLPPPQSGSSYQQSGQAATGPLDGEAAGKPQGIEEVEAAVEAFSTFSLHVSDVSFKLAWAALSQDQWPEPAKIRIEEFVNAFDFGDPLPTAAEKVACQIEQAGHPFLMQRNLLRIAMRTAATGRTDSTPLRLTLLLDNSGSMERVDRRQTLQRALEALVGQLKPIDQVTLISFAERPRLLADRWSGDQAEQLLPIVDSLPSEGGTNIEAALQLALEKAAEQLTSHAQHRIVLLTDGAVNLGDANPDNLSALVTAMRDTGIAFDAAGISARDLNDEVLETLTRQGDGRYYLLDAAEDAAAGFASQLAGALRPSAKNVKVQIEFNPQRVGQYKLLGFEKHRLQTEDFRNDQVDAAELAAAEAGVALYHFEALPEGTGDIGNVSVRFRDLVTGHMVERSWPIPYQSHPPRLEQASASLQLATAAALFAAKLGGDPLGDVVNLPTVASWIAGLPADEQAKTRVQQLQSMIATARQLESGRQ